MLDKLKSHKLSLSIEVFPPKKEGHLENIIRALKNMQKLQPDFISITYGASGSGSDKTADVASVAIDAFDFNVIAHLTAVNMTTEKLEQLIDTYRRKNIKNLLLLRGDLSVDSQFYDFKHASDLAYYIKTHHPDFTLFGACYPEAHPEAPSLDIDLDYLKLKADNGISAFITQLFLDNNVFYDFMDKYTQKGIDRPICAGIMPIISTSQISRIVSMCGVMIPAEFAKMVENNQNDLYQSGIDFAIRQIDQLIINGFSNIHIYSMNKADVAEKVFDKFKHLR